METTKKTAVILLSGGLDSLVSLDIAKKKNIDIKLALTFNYGQKALQDEIEAASEICKYYKIEHKIIDIPFLKEISKNALTQAENNALDTLEGVWIPNRNGLFLNIAACFCDKLKYDYIIFGANLKEAKDFPDNSKEFIKRTDEFFKFSTLNSPLVLAPCAEFDKIEIINYAIDNNVPLNLLKSCYDKTKEGKKHCGKCMSCKLLKEAISKSKNPKLIEEIF